MIRGLFNSVFGVGGYNVKAPTVDTKAGARAIDIQSKLGAQRAGAQAYSLAAGARGSSVPLALREAQRRGSDAQANLAQQAMAQTAALEQGAAAQNAQMQLGAAQANAAAKAQEDAAFMGTMGTLAAGAMVASDERTKRGLVDLEKQVDTDIAKMGGPPATAGVLPSMLSDANPRPGPGRSAFPRPIMAGVEPEPEPEPAPSMLGPRPGPARAGVIAARGPQRVGPGLSGTDYGLTDQDMRETFAAQSQRAEPAQRALAADAWREGASARQRLGISDDDARAAFEQEQAGLPARRTAPYQPGGPAGAYPIPTTSYDPDDSQERWAQFLSMRDGMRTSDKTSKDRIAYLEAENSHFKNMISALSPEPKPKRPAILGHATIPMANRISQFDAFQRGKPRDVRSVMWDDPASKAVAVESSQPLTQAEQQRLDDRARAQAAAAAAAAAPARPSDKGTKDDVRRAELGLDKVHPVSFEYREPWSSVFGGDRQVGVLAQDLEKAPATRTLVKRAPDGTRMIDNGRATSFLLASSADLDHRLRRLEGGRG